ncbi:MAG TPA: DUF4180 domain-containing protein [Pseudonocardiaceae bacterium]|jgi:hypothetical protein
MADTIAERHGIRVLLCDPDGARMRSDRDVVDLIARALEQRAELVAVPVARLDERFFPLSTGVAGDVMQKFVNYRLRLAIVGDIAAHLGASTALPALVRESNRGRQLWFVADLAELDARLAAG